MDLATTTATMTATITPTTITTTPTTRAANEEEEDPHPRGFWLILLPHSPGNEIFDSSYSSFLEE